MLKKISNADEMSFLVISETYPDDYILAQITKTDDNAGVELGIVLYTSPAQEELYLLAEKEGLSLETIIIEGENLRPMLGGFM
ncbi:MAG: hypothetical protein FWC89_04165 [Defluviitaleaceae bacterium]|nr:hypothetical protein [Defluviitaleaceae bacterium]